MFVINVITDDLLPEIFIVSDGVFFSFGIVTHIPVELVAIFDLPSSALRTTGPYLKPYTVFLSGRA